MKGIGRQTDYAARIVLHLATLPEGEQITAHEIASRKILPAAFVRRIVGQLAAEGILLTTRGARGGVSLARPAGDISLLDILVAMEGGLVLNACVDDPKACPMVNSCPVQSGWTQATRMLEEFLRGVRFDSLAAALDGPSPPDKDLSMARQKPMEIPRGSPRKKRK